jgi:hypothetical protein
MSEESAAAISRFTVKAHQQVVEAEALDHRKHADRGERDGEHAHLIGLEQPGDDDRRHELEDEETALTERHPGKRTPYRHQCLPGPAGEPGREPPDNRAQVRSPELAVGECLAFSGRRQASTGSA